MKEIIIMIISWLIYGFTMYLSGENKGYMEGFNEALEGLNKRANK